MRPGGAGVLPLHPGRGGAFLQKAGVVHDQYCLRVAEVLDDVVAYIAQDLIGIPLDPVQQPVDAIRTGMAGLLGQRPGGCPLRGPFFRSCGAISPRRYASADWRGSIRLNRCTNRPCTASNSFAHSRASARSPPMTTSTTGLPTRHGKHRCSTRVRLQSDLVQSRSEARQTAASQEAAVLS